MKILEKKISGLREKLFELKIYFLREQVRVVSGDIALVQFGLSDEVFIKLFF